MPGRRVCLVDNFLRDIPWMAALQEQFCLVKLGHILKMILRVLPPDGRITSRLPIGTRKIIFENTVSGQYLTEGKALPKPTSQEYRITIGRSFHHASLPSFPQRDKAS